MAEALYAGGLDNDLFHDEFESLKEAEDYYTKDLNNGDEYYVGKIKRVSVGELIDIDWLADQMQENAGNEAGEAAEDYLNDFTAKDRSELHKLIVEFFEKKKLTPDFYAVNGIEKFVVKK